MTDSARMLVGSTLPSAVAAVVDPLLIVDVGASEYGTGRAPYAALLSGPRTEVIGFDVGVQGNALGVHKRAVQLPRLVTDGQRRRFYRCAVPMTSSLLRPNTAFIEGFEGLAKLYQVVGEELIDTIRLDDVPGIDGVDYLKVNVQGATLLVLEGAAKTLPKVLAVHTEVEFAPMYEEAPRFGDVDAALRSHGSHFHHFVDFGCCRMLSDTYAFGSSVTRQLWCDAVFFRSFGRIGSMEPRSLVKLAANAHDCYAAEDLASACLDRADAMMATNLGLAYRSALRSENNA